MEILRFAAEDGRELHAHGSHGVRLAPLCRPAGRAQVVCMHVAPGGVVGRHPAGVAQIFAVVAGGGWVRGENGGKRPLRSGEAALFAAGEWHESGASAEEGMTAIVIECERINAAGAR